MSDRRKRRAGPPRTPTLLVLAMLLAACTEGRDARAVFNLPVGLDERALRAHAVVKSQNGVRVAAAVPADAQLTTMFGVDLVAKGVQPLWIEIRNGAGRPFLFLPTGLDPEYFAPREVAALFRGEFGDQDYQVLADYLDSVSLNSRSVIEPGETAIGIVYVNRVEPTISAQIDLVGQDWSQRISLLVPIPGTESVQRRLEDLARLAAAQMVENIRDESALRTALEDLPCCANGGDDAAGPPVNFVVIGNVSDVISMFARSRYRYRAIEPMRLFGRMQDMSAKKISRWVAPKPLVIRGWLTPLRFRDTPVSVLQVSTPRGGRFGSSDAAIDNVDPRMDDARDSLLQELLYSQSVSKFGFVRGAGREGSELRTDGLRAVIVLGTKPVSLSDIDFLEWERLANHRR